MTGKPDVAKEGEMSEKRLYHISRVSSKPKNLPEVFSRVATSTCGYPVSISYWNTHVRSGDHVLTYLAKEPRHTPIHRGKCFWESEKSGGGVALVGFDSPSTHSQHYFFLTIVV